MTSVILIGLLVGFLAANGLPHFVKGITGEKHQTPFGQPSSAMVNVAWGWANWVVAAILFHIPPMRFHPRAAFLGIAIGVLVCGWWLSTYWTKNPHHNK